MLLITSYPLHYPPYPEDQYNLIYKENVKPLTKDNDSSVDFYVMLLIIFFIIFLTA